MMDIETTRQRLEKLHTALITDVLDQLGHLSSAVGPDVRPMAPGQRLAGPAFTMRCAPLEAPSPQPYQHLIGAYADMTPGVIIVLQCADRHSAMWGELLSIAARVKGAVGAVLDGLARDVDQTVELDFPVFSAGFTPLDSSGRQEVVEHGTTIRCGDAVVNPGDWIVGDVMGVAVIPAELVPQVLELAEAKDSGESTARADLLRGDEIRDVFVRYGIL